ncbi:flagellar motor stator protein MotA [Thorsellia anophelis]|uniref:Chemotaxis protein MotA n=1 Tax=Thorsellia anophelis DSM 18579 TaxID=1123402 RepID=A0A1I0BYK6_9GAMM|nr:flagellar motor stator protein MotA [Thorsellia anophelis]SET11816.1 chemotaxis protein MotA [Thorsellia anophelis DSM 18579]
MLIIIGYLVVTFSVLGGFVLAGGHLGALNQPLELLIIGGAAVGAMMIANTGKSLKASLKAVPAVLKSSKYDKALFLDVISVLFLILSKARQQGMLSLESDIDSPNESEIFSAYPKLLANHEIIEFITDYLRLMVSGNMSAFEIEALMDEEIETHEHEADIPATTYQTVGDGLPAFGIVAAVLGVIKALGSADLPPEELGLLIAHAMVGTFLGILLAYGYVAPLASILRQRNAEHAKVYQCIKVILLASLNGYAPQIAVEFGRKTLYSTERPTFTQLEDHIRQVKASSTKAQ